MHKLGRDSKYKLAVLDVSNMQWIDTVLDMDMYEFYVHSLLVTRGNDVHFVYPYESVSFHGRIHLSQLLPFAVYRKYVGPLIYGYIRTMANDLSLKLIIPTEIKDVVLMFY